jgi:hypothetical protein
MRGKFKMSRLAGYLREGKKDYVIYHGTYTEAVQEIERFAKKNGYTLDDESEPEDIGAQMYDVVGRGPRKPSGGKTNSLHFKLYKNNKEQRKNLHAQVYGDGNRFELNMYIS